MKKEYNTLRLIMSSQQKKDIVKNEETKGGQNLFKNPQSVEDLHLRVSEKYQVYKDLSDRCLINTSTLDKGDKRVFYLKPQENPFLDEPRKQNLFRNNFVKTISTPPAPEPLTLLADDLYRDLLEQVSDKSCPSLTKGELVQFFKRRQYNLQHKKYKMTLRWAHYALTSELVDKVSLKFSPTYSKIQFELENAVKRQQRLEGEDHFLTHQRPQAKANAESLMTLKEEKLEQLSTLRIDDIDVYLRQVTYEQRVNKEAEKFIQRVKWAPLSHRFEIFQDSIDYVQGLRTQSLDQQRQYVTSMDEKGQHIISYRKLPKQASHELSKILKHQHVRTYDLKCEKSIKDKIFSSSRYDYHLPSFMIWNEVDLKLKLSLKAKQFGILGDMDIDSGHSFAYNIFVFFPTYFQTQVVKSQFARYEAVPGLIELSKEKKEQISNDLQRGIHNKRQSDIQSQISSIGSYKKEQYNFVNSVESSLFGEYNSGQIKDFPSIRIKESYWIPYICFTPQINQALVYQTAALSQVESNPLDECTRHMLDLLNVQDVANVQLILEGLATIHHDKVKHGHIRSDFLLNQVFLTPEQQERVLYSSEESPLLYTDAERSFLSIFSQALKPQSAQQEQQQQQTNNPSELLQLPQHLLYSLYMLKYLRARDHKCRMLYTLNLFRAVQKRVTLEMREMGTRDRVMGDCIYLPPSPTGPTTENTVNSSSAANSGYYGLYNIKEEVSKDGQQAASKTDVVDVINDELIDIHKVRFNDRLQNCIFSTNPILPRFHSTFGEPLSKQEISSEMQSQKNQDNKKDEGKKLLGRLDTIYFNDTVGCYLVKDDFDKHIMFDSALLDMKLMEEEVLKIVSYYINKQEPILAESDLRNTFPACDRFELIEEIFECELNYQNCKAELVLSYMECLEHISDLLEQQRLVQIIVDLMATRPRLNLQATHFKDSYTSECESLKLQHDLIRELIRMQMKSEFEANNQIREYLERTYRLVMDMGDNKWQYQKPETLDAEVRNRENLQKGLTEDNQQKAETNDQQEQPKVTSAKFSDPKEFAAYLGIPFSSLQMLMKDHKERDPMVQQTIHEHVSFIKIEEGYPIFMYDMSAKLHNTVVYSPGSERIGMLDFYESLTILVKLIAAMKGAFTELYEVHHPDNGLTLSALELCTYRYFQAELKMVKGESQLAVDPPAANLNYIEDDSILGNSDRMLFYAKEFAASADDEQASHNPYVLTKLNMKTISNFSFDTFQKLLQDNQNLGDALSQQDGDSLNKRRKINQHHAYRFFPKLKARAQKVFIPSMLFLTCNSIEVLRLRHLLSIAIQQKLLLEKVYQKQVQTLRKDGIIYFKDPFNFQTFIDLGDKNYINFVDEGPGSGIDLPLAINEFDPTLRSHLNFSDPDSFKMMLCPLGLEELRLVLLYELTNLQTLIVATRTNQSLLDTSLRHLAEIDLFQRELWVLPNPTYNYYARIAGSRGMSEAQVKKQAVAERQAATANMQRGAGEVFYNVISRKNRSRLDVQNGFQKARGEIVAQEQGLKSEGQLRKLRTYRAIMCQDFCFDILSEVYCDAIKLQIINQCDTLRKRSYLQPKQQIFIDHGTCDYGEYKSYYNNLQDNIDLLDGLGSLAQSTTRRQNSFYDDHQKQTAIQKFWRLPSNFEIIKLIDSKFDKLREIDFKHCYVFENKQNKMTPDLSKNGQHKLLRLRMPTIKPIEMKDLDSLIKNKKRFVDYQNALSFEKLPLLSLLSYFNSVQNLFDLEFFQAKISSNSKTQTFLEHSVMSGLSFWELSEEELIALQDEATLTAPPNDDGSFISNLGYKNQLAQKLVERVANEKRLKLTFNQDLEVIKDRFSELEKTMTRLELHSSIEKAGQFIQEQYQIAYYSIIASLGQVMEKLVREGTGQKECLDINSALSLLNHQNDVKVTYTNGFHANHAVTRTDQIFLDENSSMIDYSQFMKSAQPIIDEKALIPNQFTLLQSLYTPNHVNQITFKKTRIYMGKLPPRDYHYLDYQLLTLEAPLRKQITNYISSIDSSMREYLRHRFGASEDVLNASSNLDFFLEILRESKAYLRTFIRTRQLKRAVVIIQNKGLVGSEPKEIERAVKRYKEEIQWKVDTQWDEEQAEKMKKQSKNNAEMKEKAVKAEKEAPGSITAQQIAKVLKQQKEKAMSNAIQQYEQTLCEIDVLQKEIHRFLLVTTLRLFDQESAALSRAFELNGKQFDFYIHPCQQFASTVDQHIDKRHHLDSLNKVSFAQKFLTQIRNRCLEIETLTSGIGVVISQKDLNECLEETCRGIIKHNEIEMRTRCETHAMQLSHLENLLYIKDQQLRTLEDKMTEAKGQLDKIIRTKVFSRGKQLVYELDFSTRQLRLIKDNIFSFEHRLTEQVGVAFERELTQTKMELNECRRKFLDFQNAIETTVYAGVRENANSIDALMKSRAEHFKNSAMQASLERQEKMVAAAAQQASNTTINIGSITIKNINSPSKTKTMASFLMHKQQTPEELMIEQLDKQVKACQQQLLEYDTLKTSERQAHEEILKLQDLIRKLRLMFRFKEVLTRQKYEHELESLRAQLNSNTQLWHQLAESEKREKILKADLDRTQQQIVTQEKIIEQLKDDKRKGEIERAKLEQYKSTKSKRLEDLEGKAREFEVFASINVQRMIGMLESKEDRIKELKSKDRINEAQISSQQKNSEHTIQSFRRRLERESVVKAEAIERLENMRTELQMIEGTGDVGLSEMWKEKCRKLIEICKSFKDENERLQFQNTLNSYSSQNGNIDDKIDIKLSSISTVNSNNAEQQSRFKYGSRNQNAGFPNYSMQAGRQIIQPLFQNQSFGAVTASQQINQSSVLSGSVNTSIKYQNSFLNVSNQSQFNNNPIVGGSVIFHSAERNSSQNNINHLKGSRRATAFASQIEQANNQQALGIQRKQVSSPKTPIQTLNDQESHLTSIAQNLDPMYVAFASNKGLKNAAQKSDNVFASLKNSTLQNLGNLSLQTGALLDDSSPIQQQYPILSSTLNQPTQFHNPQIIMTNHQQSRNLTNNNIFQTSTGQTIQPINQATSNSTYDSNRLVLQSKSFSNSFVRSRIISPPKAMQKDVEHTGMKGGSVFRRNNNKD